jgi:hypothetical protein
VVEAFMEDVGVISFGAKGQRAPVHYSIICVSQSRGGIMDVLLRKGLEVA